MYISACVSFLWSWLAFCFLFNLDELGNARLVTPETSTSVRLTRSVHQCSASMVLFFQPFCIFQGDVEPLEVSPQSRPSIWYGASSSLQQLRRMRKSIALVGWFSRRRRRCSYQRMQRRAMRWTASGWCVRAYTQFFTGNTMVLSDGS